MAFSILSSLAEGADRLVTHEVLKIPNSQLEAVLPFGEKDYIRDFKDPKSKLAFKELLSRAHHVLQLPPATTRSEGYAQAGRYVVDHCDVLIALWDGKAAERARDRARVLSERLDVMTQEPSGSLEVEASKPTVSGASPEVGSAVKTGWLKHSVFVIGELADGSRRRDLSRSSNC